MLKLMFVTAEPGVAQEAVCAGVDRIFVDLEYINKSERQRGRNTLISHNTVEDVEVVRRAIPDAVLLVRVNPMNPGLEAEVERVVECGADLIMLPMVIDAEDAGEFVAMVGGRARTCLLLETAQAVVRMEEILRVGGIDEVYFGLNDMHISMGLDFMFELLSGGIVEYMGEKAAGCGMPFGFGGIARIGEGMLAAELVLGEHYRLHSSSVILSRTFRGERSGVTQLEDLAHEVERIRDCERQVAEWSVADFEANRLAVRRAVHRVCASLRRG